MKLQGRAIAFATRIIEVFARVEVVSEDLIIYV